MPTHLQDLFPPLATDGVRAGGVNGTPTFLANRLCAEGGYTYEILAAALNGLRV